MALPIKERQNCLRCRVAARDLLPPGDLLMKRSFLVVVAVMRLPGPSLFASIVLHLMIASRSVIKAIAPARSLPSRGSRVSVAVPPRRRSRSGPPLKLRRSIVVARRSRKRFSTATALVVPTRMRRSSLHCSRPVLFRNKQLFFVTAGGVAVIAVVDVVVDAALGCRSRWQRL